MAANPRVKRGNASIPLRDASLPRLDPSAYHGITGQIVSAVAPHTEADPAALLVSVLAAAGAVAGDGAHVLVGGSRHPMRIWPLVIGRTASGRKGESWAQTENTVISFDPSFAAKNIASGLSTGEGIIAAQRDSDDDDAAPRDKRLLVVESEFGRTLGVTRREGNTLSQVLRGLWESGRAAVMTRADPLTCSGAHLVVVAHVTPHELREKLAGSSGIAGGLMNRFLPVVAHRPQLLSGEPEQPDTRAMAAQLGRAVEQARMAGQVRYRRTAAAEKLWDEAYRAIADDEEDGPLGEILARGPSYALRLALTYAVLDTAAAIGEEHLTAGLAVWQYAAASARHVFGDLGARTDLERLARYLADSPTGRTRSEIIGLFSRNRSADEITALVGELVRRGDAQTETERSGKAGRPTERAYWTGAPADALSELLGRHALEETP